jgi:hypothetical protein
MKKICLILCVVSSPLFAQQVATLVSLTPRVEIAAFTWTSTSHDFGKIPLNKPVTHEFRFTNAGNTPLIISSVQASCGCTVTDYSKDPVGAGGEGYVKATYNAAKAGMFTKTVTVNANADESIVQLIIKGEVVE